MRALRGLGHDTAGVDASVFLYDGRAGGRAPPERPRLLEGCDQHGTTWLLFDVLEERATSENDEVAKVLAGPMFEERALRLAIPRGHTPLARGVRRRNPLFHAKTGCLIMRVGHSGSLFWNALFRCHWRGDPDLGRDRRHPSDIGADLLSQRDERCPEHPGPWALHGRHGVGRTSSIGSSIWEIST